MTLIIQPDAPPLRVDSTGTVRVGNTRVTLETVIEQFLAGATAPEIAARFPLDVADVYSVFAYYLRHRAEVDCYLDEQRRQADAARQQAGDRYQDWPAVRERLLARKVEESDGDAALPGG